jgi:hypothetical protein
MTERERERKREKEERIVEEYLISPRKNPKPSKKPKS